MSACDAVTRYVPAGTRAEKLPSLTSQGMSALTAVPRTGSQKWAGVAPLLKLTRTWEPTHPELEPGGLPSSVILPDTGNVLTSNASALASPPVQT